MASRSGGGMGVTVALVISIMLNLALVLLVMLMYTKKDQAEQNLTRALSEVNEFVRSGERELDEFKKMKTKAQAANKSVVAWQRDEFKAAMANATGNREMDRRGLEAVLSSEGLENSDLLAGFRNERGRADSSAAEAQSLREQLDISEQRLADFTAERDRMLADHRATIDSLNAEIGRIQKRADDYARRVEDAERDMDRRVADIRSDYEKQVTDATLQLEEAKSKIASQADSLQALRDKMQSLSGSGVNEGALADGQILEVLEDGSVFIDLGEQEHVVLGMRFEVYGDETETRPDATGAVPAGKATVEVTRVDATTSMARVIRSTRGRAVVKSDILVNPIYDRNKTYSFFVFGDFDLDGVNGPSELETETVKSLIKSWGGTITDEFRGDVDFLVLGVEPSKPGPLPPNPSPVLVRQHVEQTRGFNQYRDYIAQAGNISIPVLNQNRLFTLIGYYGP